MFNIARHQKKTIVREFTTLSAKKTLGSLRQMKGYSSICSKEVLWAAVAEDEAITPLETKVQGDED